MARPEAAHGASISSEKPKPGGVAARASRTDAGESAAARRPDLPRESREADTTGKRVGLQPDSLHARRESDETLVLRYQRGEAWAFDELLRRHGPGVMNFVYGYLGDYQKAEDAYQEVFMRLIRAAGTFESRALFRTWLYRIARNVCVDALRKQERRKAASLDALTDEGGEVAFSGTATETDDAVARDELQASLNDAVASLPPEQREVFALRERAGLRFEQIAHVTNCSKNTAKSRMRYALHNIRQFLEKKGFSEDTVI